MVGKVDYDETRLAYITAWVPGRLDRLYVDYTGVPVREGDHMVYIYSPELLSAQEELIQALATVQALKNSDVGIVRETTEATAVAAREKLRLLGLTAEQIERVVRTGQASEHLTIYSPAAGIVIHKNAQEGMYVKTGTRIYTIADLSQVWVKLDAYESDLEWLRYGQKIEFTTVSYPGRVFTGTIAFIDPILMSGTRTVKVRVNAPNADGRLKPGMFVKAIARTQVASGGRVMDPDLAGKWMCRMHPEVVKDEPGACDICEMPLERTESLGYVGGELKDADKPLVIPVTAALRTGTRAVVYVQVPDADQPTYEGREIVLGPRAGDYYLVQTGLREGEHVVVRGNFKIDSALQILAKPAMMSPEGGGGGGGHDHGGGARKRADGPKDVGAGLESPATLEAPFSPSHGQDVAGYAAVSEELRAQLDRLFVTYFELHGALVDDDFEEAMAASLATRRALASVDMRRFAGADHDVWMKLSRDLEAILSDVDKAEDIESLRYQFSLLSEQMIAVADHFGPTPRTSFFTVTCPMAFNDRGATWLQADSTVRNPYFGTAMLGCGDVVNVIQAQPQRRQGDSGHENERHE